MNPFPADITPSFLGRSLNSTYFQNVVTQIKPSPTTASAVTVWCVGDSTVGLSQPIRTIGFTGTQDISNLGFRITYLLAQCLACMGYCTASGNAYGVDLTSVLGTLARSEF